MIDRKARQRALKKARIVHAAGWINEDDKPEFDRIVSSAASKVQEVLGSDRDPGSDT